MALKDILRKAASLITGDTVTLPSRTAISASCKNQQSISVNNRDVILGKIAAALNHRDGNAFLEGLDNLVQEHSSDPDLFQIVTVAVDQISTWDDFDVLLHASDIINAGDREDLVLFSDTVTLNFLRSKETIHPSYALEAYLSILRKDDEGDQNTTLQFSDELTSKCLEGVLRICQGATPESGQVLLRDLNDFSEDTRDEFTESIHGQMIHLADLIQTVDPLLSLQAYAIVFLELDDENDQNESLIQKIITSSKALMYVRKKEVAEVLREVHEVLIENSDPHKQIQGILAVLDDNEPPKDYSSSAPMTASVFQMKYGISAGPSRSSFPAHTL